MTSKLPRIPPEVHETALNIAVMGRIVVQGFIPPGLWAETERRIFLTAVAEILQLRDGRPATPLPATPEGDAS